MLFARAVRRIHCLGVGGMGVAPLAIYLAQSGFSVTGEDDALDPAMAALLERERVGVGPLPADCDLVVYSSAIAPAHPAYAAARDRGLPLVRRGEALAEVVRERKLVAICGSHGKTTTTAMLAAALRQANFPAGYILGGLARMDRECRRAPARTNGSSPKLTRATARSGALPRRSRSPVNLDWDHPDHYRRPEDLESAFAAHFARTRGAVLVSDACARSLRLGSRAGTASRPSVRRRPPVLLHGRHG